MLAYEKSAIKWEIKQTNRAKDLRMPSCSSIAVPKKSPSGTIFSYHTKAKDNCASAAKSPEHKVKCARV